MNTRRAMAIATSTMTRKLEASGMSEARAESVAQALRESRSWQKPAAITRDDVEAPDL
jgi:uncharacterized protein YoaH (UPF0181 family)